MADKHKVYDTKKRFKAVMLDYDHVFSLATTRNCYALSDREVSLIISSLDMQRWETRWYGSGTISKAEIVRLVDGTINQLMSSEECETMPTQFRFVDCVLEYSNDGGETWTPVTGWPEAAGSCFQGAPGAPGAPGADGQDGAPGRDGCSPYVWVEEREEDGHKILWIDTDCDDVNDYEVDLTAEIGNNDYFMCRWVRAIVPEFARVMHDGEAAALPVYDLGDTSFINAFKTAMHLEGIIDDYEPTPALVNELANLYYEGYEYNAALADACLDEDMWNEPMRDLLVTLTKPEFTNEMLFNYLPFVENQPEVEEVQWWYARLLFALWADQKRMLETWSWRMLAYPVEGDCRSIRALPASFYHMFELVITPYYVSPVAWQNIWDAAFPEFSLVEIGWQTESSQIGGNTFRIGVIWADDIASGIVWLMSANPEQEVLTNSLVISPAPRGIVYIRVEAAISSPSQTSTLNYIEVTGRGSNPFWER